MNIDEQRKPLFSESTLGAPRFQTKLGQNSVGRDPFFQCQPNPQSPEGISLAPYVRTLPLVVDAMLDLAQVGSEDTLYDLGCGDGRILIRAAQRFGTRGMGWISTRSASWKPNSGPEKPKFRIELLF